MSGWQAPVTTLKLIQGALADLMFGVGFAERWSLSRELHVLHLEGGKEVVIICICVGDAGGGEFAFLAVL